MAEAHHFFRLGGVQLPQQYPQGGRGTGLYHDGPLPLVKGPHLLHGLFCFRQKLPGVCYGQLPCFIQGDPVFAPGEQGHAEILLQVLHGTGDGGGGNVKFLRHPAEGAQVGKGGQLLQFIEIHHGCHPPLRFRN